MPPPSPFHLKVLEASVTRVQLRLQLRDADGDRGLRLAHDVGGALLLLLELDLQLRQALLQARDVYLLGLQLVGEEVVDVAQVLLLLLKVRRQTQVLARERLLLVLELCDLLLQGADDQLPLDNLLLILWRGGRERKRGRKGGGGRGREGKKKKGLQ